jgi:hypothetical protein
MTNTCIGNIYFYIVGSNFHSFKFSSQNFKSNIALATSEFDPKNSGTNITKYCLEQQQVSMTIGIQNF